MRWRCLLASKRQHAKTILCQLLRFSAEAVISATMRLVQLMWGDDMLQYLMLCCCIAMAIKPPISEKRNLILLSIPWVCTP